MSRSIDVESNRHICSVCSPLVRGGFFIFLALFALPALAEFAGGDGSSEDPFQIETAEHLNAVRNQLDAHFVQTANIDLGVAPWNEGSGWVPIGTEDEPFIGTYDGNGLEVQGLFINRPAADYQGLFGYAEGARIENIGIAGFAITAANRSGGLVGQAVDDSAILHCWSSGEITGVTRTGGLAGSLQNGGRIEYSHSSANVTGSNDRIGGLAGQVWTDWIVVECSASGTVVGRDRVGGLIGNHYQSDTRNSHFTGQVDGRGSVGGLVGYLEESSLLQCFAAAEVVGPVSSTVNGTARRNSNWKQCHPPVLQLGFRYGSEPSRGLNRTFGL